MNPFHSIAIRQGAAFLYTIAHKRIGPGQPRGSLQSQETLIGHFKRSGLDPKGNLGKADP
jgi:hypothetical protein